MKTIEQPELNVTELLLQPMHLHVSGMELYITRFSRIHDNSHAWIIPAHAHAHMELHYILSGIGYIRIEGEKFAVSKDDIYITLPYTSHEQTSDAEQVMEEYCIECAISLQTDEDMIQPLKEDVGKLQEALTMLPSCGCHAGRTLFQNLLGLERELTEADHGWYLKSQLLFGECILEALYTMYRKDPLIVRSKLPSYHQKVAQQMKSYLEMYYRQPITVKEMANSFYLSTKQMNRIFREVYGTTVWAYLSDLRVYTAQSYIEKGEMSMREIAMECGFTGYSQMYRALKKQEEEMDIQEADH